MSKIIKKFPVDESRQNLENEKGKYDSSYNYHFSWRARNEYYETDERSIKTGTFDETFLSMAHV